MDTFPFQKSSNYVCSSFVSHPPKTVEVRNSVTASPHRGGNPTQLVQLLTVSTVLTLVQTKPMCMFFILLHLCLTFLLHLCLTFRLSCKLDLSAFLMALETKPMSNFFILILTTPVSTLKTFSPGAHTVLNSKLSFY